MLNSRLTIQGAAAALAVAIIASGCGLMAPKAERYAAPADGSSYVIQRRDTGSYGHTNGQVPVKVGRRVMQGDEVVTFSNPAVTVITRPSGDWIGMYAGEKPLFTWNPPISWEWPLEVGKSWTKTYQSTNHGTKRTVSYESTQKVEAYEDVTVPAGTFKAFRIKTSTSMGDDNVVWYSPELGIWVKAQFRRSATHPAGPGSRDDALLSHNIRQ
jgi:hypothetical protein